ncbi:amidohydrolase, partial [Candidatus Thorarchaeota archaeon]
ELQADLVIINANIVTMDPERPRATSLASKNYKIIAVGDDETVMDLIPTAKRVVDLGGKTVVPGFVDGHTHLTSSGIRSFHVDLTNAKSIEDAVAKLSDAEPVYEEGEWVQGWGWDESKWPKKRYLTAKDLDKVSSSKPVAAVRVDGHLLSVNTIGIEKLGFDPELEGVVKDKKGKPTGVFRDIEGMTKKLRPDEQTIREGAAAGTKIAAKAGITTAVDNIAKGQLRPIREAEKENNLAIRMVVNIPCEQLNHLVKLGITSGMGTPMCKISGVKIFTDGSIGAATAAISEAYRNQKENTGMLLMTKRKLRHRIRTAVKSGIQTVTHAIGDRAIEMVLNVFESLSEEELEIARFQRHRLEHVELITEDQIRRAASLGLILSMQPNFVGQWQQDDGLYVERLGKERTELMNNFRIVLDNGARLCFGSDGMPLGPLYGIWSATTSSNSRVKLDVEEALRCYTLESAYASFMDKTVGSLKEGKRADFVVLSHNIMKISPARIKDVEIEMTFVGGELMYSASG